MTDNHNLQAKLDLRRFFLKRIAPGFRVLDCFSGEKEVVWSTLRREFQVKEYLALDKKPKRGRLKMDSLRFLQRRTWTHDVVDLDAYGSPWEHWIEVLKRGRDATVFLTVGTSIFGMQSDTALKEMGISIEIPPGVHHGISSHVTDFMLGILYRYNMTCPLAIEAMNPGGSARYFGVQIKSVC